MVGYELFLPNKPDENQMSQDREFFEQNPSRKFYIREPYGKEREDLEKEKGLKNIDSMLVYQLKPGFRLKRALINQNTEFKEQEIVNTLLDLATFEANTKKSKSKPKSKGFGK